jgi:hypothetical protein
VAYQQFDVRMLQTGQGRNSVYHVAIPSCIAVGLPCSSAKTPLHLCSSKTTARGSPRKIITHIHIYILRIHTYIINIY